MADDDALDDGARNRMYQAYVEERKLLIDAEWDQSKRFDQTLITLSSGALALSITFVGQIAPHPRHTWLLGFAWLGFIIALVAILCSFLLSQKAMRQARDYLDNMQTGGNSNADARAGTKPEEADGGTKHHDWTQVMNVTSIVSFVVGVGFLAAFSAVNLS